MPNGKTTRKTKKHFYKRKKRIYKALRPFKPQSILKTGFPRTTLIKLRYADGFTLNPTINTLSYYSFRANSCFDPDQTGTGHQPMNFDLWAGLYNHYVVVGSRIKVTYHFPLTAQAGGLLYGVVLADDNISTTDPITMMEQNLARYKIYDGHLVTGGMPAPSLTCNFSAKKFFNFKDVADNQRSYGSVVTTNPGELAYFNIFTGPTPASITDIPQIHITVVIDYIVMFSEPKEQPLS